MQKWESSSQKSLVSAATSYTRLWEKMRRLWKKNEWKKIPNFLTWGRSVITTRIALNAPLLYVRSFQIKVRIIRVFVCTGITIHRRIVSSPNWICAHKIRAEFISQLRICMSRLGPSAFIRESVSWVTDGFRDALTRWFICECSIVRLYCWVRVTIL